MKKIIISILFISGCSTHPNVAVDNSTDSFYIKNEAELSFEEKIRLQEEIIHRQELELAKQQRELEELKRQNIYNKAVREYKDNHAIR